MLITAHGIYAYALIVFKIGTERRSLDGELPTVESSVLMITRIGTIEDIGNTLTRLMAK